MSGLKVAIIDADLLTRRNHRFPNLACMKLSAWHKVQMDSVCLKRNYSRLDNFDRVYIAKVFSDTSIPADVLKLENVIYGGSGFYLDYGITPPTLPADIEHACPDYNLYNDFVEEEKLKGVPLKSLKYYTSYSIGYTTRGCIRGCEFCINKGSRRVNLASPLSEFVCLEKKNICLLDDNILASPSRDKILRQLKDLGRPCQFKQGLDIRLLTPNVAATLAALKYDQDYIFAFDDIRDKDTVLRGLEILHKAGISRIKVYCLCGFDRSGLYDQTFWCQDIIDLLERIHILRQRSVLSYVMRHRNYTRSPYAAIYTGLARWCNQPAIFKKMSLDDFKPDRKVFELSLNDFAQHYNIKKYTRTQFGGGQL